MARSAFFDPLETDALQLEWLADERVEVFAPNEDIAAGGLRLGFGQVQFPAERIEHFHRKEGDLALVVGAEIEEPIASNAPPGHTLDLVDHVARVLTGRLAVVAEEVVPR
jgi:hypothetical protein